MKINTIWALKSGHSKNICKVKVEKYKILLQITEIKQQSNKLKLWYEN